MSPFLTERTKVEVKRLGRLRLLCEILIRVCYLFRRERKPIRSVGHLITACIRLGGRWATRWSCSMQEARNQGCWDGRWAVDLSKRLGIGVDSLNTARTAWRELQSWKNGLSPLPIWTQNGR